MRGNIARSWLAALLCALLVSGERALPPYPQPIKDLLGEYLMPSTDASAPPPPPPGARSPGVSFYGAFRSINVFKDLQSLPPTADRPALLVSIDAGGAVRRLLDADRAALPLQPGSLRAACPLSARYALLLMQDGSLERLDMHAVALASQRRPQPAAPSLLPVLEAVSFGDMAGLQSTVQSMVCAGSDGALVVGGGASSRVYRITSDSGLTAAASEASSLGVAQIARFEGKVGGLVPGPEGAVLVHGPLTTLVELADGSGGGGKLLDKSILSQRVDARSVRERKDLKGFEIVFAPDDVQVLASTSPTLASKENAAVGTAEALVCNSPDAPKLFARNAQVELDFHFHAPTDVLGFSITNGGEGGAVARFRLVSLPDLVAIPLENHQNPRGCEHCDLHRDARTAFQTVADSASARGVLGVRLQVVKWWGERPGIRQEINTEMLMMSLPPNPVACQKHLVSQGVTTTPDAFHIYNPVSPAATGRRHYVYHTHGSAADDTPFIFVVPETFPPGLYAVDMNVPSCATEGNCVQRGDAVALVTLPEKTQTLPSRVFSQRNAQPGARLVPVYRGFLMPGSQIEFSKAPQVSAGGHLVVDYLQLTPLAHETAEATVENVALAASSLVYIAGTHMQVVDDGSAIAGEVVAAALGPSHLIVARRGMQRDAMDRSGDGVVLYRYAVQRQPRGVTLGDFSVLGYLDSSATLSKIAFSGKQSRFVAVAGDFDEIEDAAGNVHAMQSGLSLALFDLEAGEWVPISSGGGAEDAEKTDESIAVLDMHVSPAGDALELATESHGLFRTLLPEQPGRPAETLKTGNVKDGRVRGQAASAADGSRLLWGDFAGMVSSTVAQGIFALGGGNSLWGPGTFLPAPSVAGAAPPSRFNLQSRPRRQLGSPSAVQRIVASAWDPAKQQIVTINSPLADAAAKSDLTRAERFLGLWLSPGAKRDAEIPFAPKSLPTSANLPFPELIETFAPLQGPSFTFAVGGRFRALLLLYSAAEQRWIEPGMRAAAAATAEGTAEESSVSVVRSLDARTLLVGGEFATDACRHLCLFDLERWTWSSPGYDADEYGPVNTVVAVPGLSFLWAIGGNSGLAALHLPGKGKLRPGEAPVLALALRASDVAGSEFVQSVDVLVAGPASRTGVVFCGGVASDTEAEVHELRFLEDATTGGLSLNVPRESAVDGDAHELLANIEVSETSFFSGLEYLPAKNALLLTGHFGLRLLDQLDYRPFGGLSFEAERDLRTHVVRAGAAVLELDSSRRAWQPFLLVDGDDSEASYVGGAVVVAANGSEFDLSGAGGGLQRWHVIVGAIGGLALLGALAAVSLFLYRRRKHRTLVRRKTAQFARESKVYFAGDSHRKSGNTVGSSNKFSFYDDEEEEEAENRQLHGDNASLRSVSVFDYGNSRKQSGVTSYAGASPAAPAAAAAVLLHPPVGSEADKSSTMRSYRGAQTRTSRAWLAGGGNNSGVQEADIDITLHLPAKQQQYKQQTRSYEPLEHPSGAQKQKPDAAKTDSSDTLYNRERQSMAVDDSASTNKQHSDNKRSFLGWGHEASYADSGILEDPIYNKERTMSREFMEGLFAAPIDLESPLAQSPSERSSSLSSSSSSASSSPSSSASNATQIRIGQRAVPHEIEQQQQQQDQTAAAAEMLRPSAVIANKFLRPPSPLSPPPRKTKPAAARTVPVAPLPLAVSVASEADAASAAAPTAASAAFVSVAPAPPASNVQRKPTISRKERTRKLRRSLSAPLQKLKPKHRAAADDGDPSSSSSSASSSSAETQKAVRVSGGKENAGASANVKAAAKKSKKSDLAATAGKRAARLGRRAAKASAAAAAATAAAAKAGGAGDPASANRESNPPTMQYLDFSDSDGGDGDDAGDDDARSTDSSSRDSARNRTIRIQPQGGAAANFLSHFRRQ